MEPVISLFLFWGLLSSLLLLSFCPSSVVSVCSQFIALSGVSPLGNITSPGWPSPYPPDALCQYKLQGEAWQGIKITFLHFDLEARYSSVGCLNDYLEVNTVDIHGQRTFLGRFCGATLPSPILVLHPTAELVFRSNHAVHSNGFVATYEFVDEAFVTTPRLNATSPCGEVVHGIGGTIVSPGYPRGYAAGLDCLWLIRVKYKHAIYVRVQHLEFQGSTANCQKAQLRLYDGYEHSLEDHTVLKKFCGDTRFYKGDEEKVLLSERNRLLIRFTTTEPSKPVNDSDAMVGFRLVWSDVEFDTAGNCTKSSRFACQEAQICFTQNHKGGASSCPDLRHYCISKELVCDGVSHCGELDPSDEKNCYKAPIVLTMVAAPLSVLTCGLCVCFCWFTRSTRRRERKRRRQHHQQHPSSGHHVQSHHHLQVGDSSSSSGGRGERGDMRKGDKEENNSSCCDCCCISSGGGYGGSSERERREQRKDGMPGEKHGGMGSFHGGGGGGSGVGGGGGKDSGDSDGGFVPSGGAGAPITRGPIYFKNELESPGASDIVSPASGFSDSESDMGSQLPIYCPAHGPIPLIPVRYLNRHFPLLPAVQEQTYQSDTYDEGGSTYSSGQNSDQMILCPSASTPLHPHHPQDKLSSSTGMVNEWRLRRGVQRSDAIYISDDGKSSIASSPGRICPRCLEKERESESGGGGGQSSRPASDPKSPGSCPLNDLDASHHHHHHHHHHGDAQGFVDSGIIDVVDCSILAIDTCGSVGNGPPVKNVSFETCTSSDSAISTKGGRTVSWNTRHPHSHHHPPPQHLQCGRFKQNNLVIEEVTSQSQTNSSVGTPTQQQQQQQSQCQQQQPLPCCGGDMGECIIGGPLNSGGGTNQGIQTDLPSPPPSTTTSQDDNNLMEEEADQEVARIHEQQQRSSSFGGGGGGNFRGGGCGSNINNNNSGSSAFCVTVTTFGVAPSGTGPDRGGGMLLAPSSMPTTAKATDV